MTQARETPSHTVLHVIYSLFSGGAERLIETLASSGGKGKYGHSVCSLTTGGDLAAGIEAGGTRVYFLGKKKGSDPSAAWKLASLVRRLSPSILHLHGAPAGFWGTAALLLSGKKMPVVRTEHRPWIPEDLPLRYRATYRFQAGRAARIIAVSDHARASFAKRFPSLSPKLVTIHNGIDLSRFLSVPPKADCRKMLGLPAEGGLAGTVGRLVPVKNHSVLLESFRRVSESLPGSHLAIVGEGHLEKDIRARISDMGMEGRVSMISSVEDVSSFLGALDLFVLSSDSEGLPMTILEAMATGLPVVSTSVGGIPEAVVDGSSGILVPAGDAAALSEGIVHYLSDTGAAARAGTVGRERAKARFSAERCSSMTERVYDELLGLSGREG